MKKIYILGLLLFVVILTVGCTKKNNQEVNVYTTRHYDADDALYAEFTNKTGIQVNVVTDKGAVSIEKIKEQGEAVVADVFMTSDAGNLALAKNAGILQVIESDILEQNIPAKYQDLDNQWFGLTKRARIFYYSKERVTIDDLKNLTYESLVTNTRWTNKVLVRSSSNMYNQSLIASFIGIHGVDATTQWVNNLVNQMARDPEGSDRDQAVAIRDGIGDIGIGNSYYYGQIMSETDSSSKYYGIDDKVGIFFPNQGEDESGVHINISGAGIVKNSKNKENAIKLLEFLSEVKQQETFSASNYEFPVNPEAKPSELITGWLTSQGITNLKEQDINLSLLGTHNQAALNIMISSKWDTPKNK